MMHLDAESNEMARTLSSDFRIQKCLICIHTELVITLQDPSSGNTSKEAGEIKF